MERLRFFKFSYHFDAIIAGILGLISAYACYGAYDCAVNHSEPACAAGLIGTAAIVGALALYSRNFVLENTGKTGLLIYYIDALKDLKYDLKIMKDENRRKRNFAKEDARLINERTAKYSKKQRLEAIERYDQRQREEHRQWQEREFER
ncbi:MAG: hypothetical protein PHR96_03885 [Clostridia bacterium]|nr:hypothetical protein [Clostridia bacterium]